MTLKDISNGPSWIIWVVFAIFVIMTIFLLTGRGSGLIAGFNTMSEEEKQKYDEKKLCRGMGIGFLIIDVVILIMLLGEAVLPAWFAYVAVGIIVVDAIGMIVVGNLLCKNRP